MDIMETPSDIAETTAGVSTASEEFKVDNLVALDFKDNRDSLNAANDLNQVLFDTIMEPSDDSQLESFERTGILDSGENIGESLGFKTPDLEEHFSSVFRENEQADSVTEIIEAESDKGEEKSQDSSSNKTVEEAETNKLIDDRSTDANITSAAFEEIGRFTENLDKADDKINDEENVTPNVSEENVTANVSEGNVTTDEEQTQEQSQNTDPIVTTEKNSKEDFPYKDKNTEQNSEGSEKDKGEQTTYNREYVALDDKNEENQRDEFISVNPDKYDNENEDSSKDNEAQTNSLENEAEKDENQGENPLCARVEGKNYTDKGGASKDDMLEEDHIAPDGFITEDQEGVDEELCIIPDVEAEKEVEFFIPPLREISKASASTDQNEEESSVLPQAPVEVAASLNKIEVSKCNIETFQTCLMCFLKRKVKYTVTKDDNVQYICHDNCLGNFKVKYADKYVLNWEGEIRVKDLASIKEAPILSYERKCVVCKKKTDDEGNYLTWEMMDFCREFCLSKYQQEIGSVCTSCNAKVSPNSLGKYCVRVNNDIRQFCSSHCLEEYKKCVKVCSYCQKDMSSESDGFLAPVGDKGHFKDFCSPRCMEKYDIIKNNKTPMVEEGTKCSVCKTENSVTIEYENGAATNYFCGNTCFVAFSFVNNITPGKCWMCRRYFPNEILEKNTMFYDNVHYSFCSNICQNIYIVAHRNIVPCDWCKVKKYNFDMIRRYSGASVLNMCSINCLSLFQVSVNVVHSKETLCNFCNKRHQPMYHLTMSDATICNFCSYTCVMSYQNKFKKSPITLNNSEGATYPVPAGEPKKSLTFELNQRTCPKLVSSPLKIEHHIIVKPALLPDQRNVATMCKLRMHHKSTTMDLIMVDKTIQTDEQQAQRVLIPIPIPVYIPSPLPMYSVPTPYPLPFPIPMPVPIFIPTNRNSAKGIMEEIKKIRVKIPTDPYEAELLMIASDKKEENSDSEGDVDDAGPGDEGTFSPEPADASNTFGDDMLQMPLKMATELETPAEDFEGALTVNTVTALQSSEPANDNAVDDPQPMMQQNKAERQFYRGRKRGGIGGKQGVSTKRRRMCVPAELPVMPAPVSPPEPAEKSDGHSCLKYTIGVHAWNQWVTTKNAELEKFSKYAKPFKTEILELSADELNHSLCLFVKELRKPNGAEYAPDTIYYLCLGIQQYLFENNRTDNIFCDPYYEQFTDSLDEVARKLSVLYNDLHYIRTRVEEEHLWESKQLGAHSPRVLLSTLIFFNTKHFNLTSVQEHMQISFSHIMKHCKKYPNLAGVGSRNVLLRLCPPQTATQDNTRKKKVYEQQENDKNPLRCPVRLYEFYLSKCPESVKTRSDVLYLQPERSCAPDSPIWYSTKALPQESLEKILHRIKMVKEINIALLTN